ncbi:MAG: protein kinase, partial [Planctomycetes bacterium]|nr:protein kinase [Planctomycetota bacterium]
MTPERWVRLRDLFDRASQLPANERAAWVATHCPDDDEIARTVNSLLARLEASKDFLEPIETAKPTVPPVSQPGRRLGDFELVEPIGRGGMGVVHRARQIGLGREVAIKELPAALFPTQNDVERFLREAKAAARLAHPAIVHVFTFGQDAGTHWFAMELVDGHDLARELTHQAAAANGDVA